MTIERLARITWAANREYHTPAVVPAWETLTPDEQAWQIMLVRDRLASGSSPMDVTAPPGWQLFTGIVLALAPYVQREERSPA